MEPRMKTNEDEAGKALDPARLPHQPPMRWIRAARSVSEHRVLAEAMLPAECGEDGRAEVLLGLEVLAQAAGLLLAASAGAGEQPREGRLLQVKEARWKTAPQRPAVSENPCGGVEESSGNAGAPARKSAKKRATHSPPLPS